MSGKELKEKLFNVKKNGWDNASDEERGEIFKFADEYMYFLNRSKTERELIATAKDILLKNNFKDLNDVQNIYAGDKVFYINRDKCFKP